MTLGKFLIQLRKRLQDVRTSSGVAIVGITEASLNNANTDGVRWTSNELKEVTNNALIELPRLVQLSQNPVVKQLGINNMVAQTTISLTTGVSTALATTVLAVLSVTKSGDKYAYITPDKYIEYAQVNDFPRSGEYFYTVMFVPEAGRKIYTLPADSFTATFTYVYARADFSSLDTEMYMNNMDDLLLDLAERECRDREKNWERSQILDIRIAQKLGLSNVNNSVNKSSG